MLFSGYTYFLHEQYQTKIFSDPLSFLSIKREQKGYFGFLDLAFCFSSSINWIDEITVFLQANGAVNSLALDLFLVRDGVGLVGDGL